MPERSGLKSSNVPIHADANTMSPRYTKYKEFWIIERKIQIYVRFFKKAKHIYRIEQYSFPNIPFVPSDYINVIGGKEHENNK